MPNCACSLHATCLGLFFIAGLGLGASHYLTLSVVCLCWAWFFYSGYFETLHVILCNFQVPQGLVVAVRCTFHDSKKFQLLVLAWGHLVVLRWWLLVASYVVLPSNWLLGCPKVFWLFF